MNAYEERLRSKNLLHILQNRESGYHPIGPGAKFRDIDFYHCITPNLTVDCAVPNVFIRKFTPDGSKLLAFSHDQRSLHVYKYKGISSARLGHLMQAAKVGTSEYFTGNDNSSSSRLTNTIFDEIFDTTDCLKLRLCQGDSVRYYLHREFSIFLEDGRYVLLAAICMTNGAIATRDYIRYPDLFDKLDAFSYIFYVVDLVQGLITDTLSLPQDSIQIPHNYGVSVVGSAVAIMSRLYQCIYMYELVDGRLIKQETIGPRPRDLNDQPMDIGVLDVTTLLPITHIKQRVLSFLYRQIDANGAQASQNYQTFNKNFEFIEHMVLEKMQLINNDLLLLRYEEMPKDSDITPILALVDPPTPRRLHVFYTIESEEVVAVYHDDSVELLQIVLHFYDQMSNVRSLQTGDAPSSPTHYLLKQNVVNVQKASQNFMRQAALRFNPSIPVSTQAYTTSPYLRYDIFNYDDRLISPSERPKACSSEPIVFRERSTNRVKFRLNVKARMQNAHLAQRELCAFICHPFEPFIISIQKMMHTYSYRMHFYNHSTIVTQCDCKSVPK
ncbi:DET1 homolog [Drosophila tropicalis]|uniref:DET1 homolog n=1 Tax=Drosophila tropicalis TaxID=46794 RepID=UPI0035AC1B26